MRSNQYAYKQHGGTDMRLAELADFAGENVMAGRYVYVSSLDIDGAFDSGPHDKLVDALILRGI